MVLKRSETSLSRRKRSQDGPRIEEAAAHATVPKTTPTTGSVDGCATEFINKSPSTAGSMEGIGLTIKTLVPWTHGGITPRRDLSATENGLSHNA